MPEPLMPGEWYTRRQVRERHGGALQGGIVPSREGRNVLLYSDESVADEFGYEDGWVEDDRGDRLFQYTGTGQVGDQGVRGLNGSVLYHRERGFDILRVFVAHDPARGEQRFRYLGEFELDAQQPYIITERKDRSGDRRNAVVFRLRPTGTVSANPIDYVKPAIQTEIVRWRPGGHGHGAVPRAAAEDRAERIAPERRTDGPSQRKPVDPVEVQRTESELSYRYQAYLQSLGHEVSRFLIRVQGSRQPLYTDLYDETEGALYEAKASASRESIRMAIGQLLDYRRHVVQELAREGQELRCLVVLLPEEPIKDLRGLIQSVKLEFVYEEPDGSFNGSFALLGGGSAPVPK